MLETIGETAGRDYHQRRRFCATCRLYRDSGKWTFAAPARSGLQADVASDRDGWEAAVGVKFRTGPRQRSRARRCVNEVRTAALDAPQILAARWYPWLEADLQLP